MDIEAYINNNINDIIDNDILSEDVNILNNINENNEDNEDDNIFDINNLQESLYLKKYDKKENHNHLKNIKDYRDHEDHGDHGDHGNHEDYEDRGDHGDHGDQEDQIDDGFYYFHLLNIFIKYYNEKYEKRDNFFSGIEDKDKDTSTMMELFFESMIELKSIKDRLDINNESLLNFYYKQEEKEKINSLFEYDQVYCLEYNKNKIFSCSLLICLNYIYDNELVDDSWMIYNLKEL